MCADRLDASQTKGRHGPVVFLPEKLRRELTSYVEQLKGRAPAERLLRTQKQDGFSANTLCQTVNAVHRQAGLDGVTSHSGRGSFITTLASKGVGVRVLAALAGHRSLSSTLVYIDANDDIKRAAVELIG
ncbi:site-specific integrase [Rhodovarius sp.]|uniref:site-specific integrase n=1 Tax=Rhodovarius sp. TaxID=2972673 RepID=UPI0033418CC7